MPTPSFTDFIKAYLEAQFGGDVPPIPGITIDSELSSTSTNPVQNKVITAALALKAAITDIPTKLSQLLNDSGYQTAAQVQTAISTAVPTKTSDLTNDSGFQTASQVQNAIAQIPDELPSVSGSDNGKFLGVVNGIWQASAVPSGGVFVVNITGDSPDNAAFDKTAAEVFAAKQTMPVVVTGSFDGITMWGDLAVAMKQGTEYTFYSYFGGDRPEEFTATSDDGYPTIRP